MRREELTQKLSDFESKQPVADWRWHGWRVWPAVRTRVALALHVDESASRRAVPAGRLAARIQRLRRFAGAKLQRAATHRADVVFLTAASRSRRQGLAYYNTLVDPWAEALAAAGLRVAVWDLGDPHWPTRVGHAGVQHALDFERRRLGRTPPGITPEWFETLAAWAAETLEADVDWPRVERDLRVVDHSARLFEAWLARVRPRAVVLDCWYGREAMGAALAAHRLAIPVVDLQHGVQGYGHPAYAGWSPAPPGGYEVFPDRFWVWGEWDAESLAARNPGAIRPEDVRVVGHRWLSAWTELTNGRHARSVDRVANLAGGRRAVLVTLQPGVPYRELLLPLIRSGDRDWLWWLRLHGRMGDDPRRLEAELCAATGRNVDVCNATQQPLHALLRMSSWHVTGFSTCALEALAFGVPTLLTHPSGAHAFANFVAQRTMFPHRTLEESRALLARSSPELDRACRSAAARVFAAPADARGLLPEESV